MKLMLDFAGHRKFRLFWRTCFFSALYFAFAAAALRLTRFDGGIPIVWAAGALLFANLTVSPRRRWPLIIAACFPGGLAAAWLYGFGGPLAAIMASVAIAEASVAAWLVKRAYPRFGRFEELDEAGSFLLVCGLLAPSIGALLGAWCAGIAGGIPFWPAWRDWYAGHALGLIVFAPPIVMALRAKRAYWLKTIGRREIANAVALLGSVAVAAFVTFGQNEVPLVLIPIVPMIFATFRLGRFGAVASILIVVTIGMTCSLLGRGPTTLLHTSMSAKFQVLQLYFACLVLILLPVAAELKARRRLLDRLSAAESLHRLILDRTSDVIIRLSVDGVVHYISPCVTRSWGYNADQITGRSIFEFIEPEDAPRVRLARSEVLANPEQSATVEYRIRSATQKTIWVESHMQASLAGSGRVIGTISIVRECTEKHQEVERLALTAFRDPLTGLNNRRAFDDALGARLLAAETQSSGCLAMFDLDHFKTINDHHGHAAGDAVLKRFAAVLLSSVREADVVARLGGEEFAVLFRNATIDQARQACERARERLAASEILSNSGELIRATVSAGISRLAFGDTPDAVLAAADGALYRAKSSGRNRLAISA